MTSSATPHSASIVQKVLAQRMGGAAIGADAGAGGVLGDDVTDRADRQPLARRAAASLSRLTNSASLAVGRAQTVVRRPSCASACSGTVRVRSRLDARTATSSGRLVAAARRDGGPPACVGLAAALLDVVEV